MNFFNKSFAIMELKQVSDGEGDQITTYIEKELITGAITTKNNLMVKIAEKDGVKPLYMFYSSKCLVFGDIIKSKDTNTLYKITSNGIDSNTPSISNLKLFRVSAERVENFS